eukprot:SAG11_NODE_6346_length_1331_cov_3.189935_2_plen_55_part_00
MFDGGSGELTPEMVLAAAEPPPEAPSVLIVMCILNLMKLLKKPIYNNPRLYLIP